jgi:1-acyl-sn-glycerol-3-phosphate acyltransferase
MSALYKAWLAAAYYASVLFFAVFSLALNLFCLLFGWLPGLAGRERLFQRLVHLDFALFALWVRMAGLVKLRYEGFDRWPKGRGLVVAINHPGLLDIAWMLARIPEAICIYKPSVGHNPLYGATARRAGYLSGDMGHLLLRAAAAKVAAGHTLLVFPEGTRTRGAGPNPLKPGFVAMARMAGAPIQLVHIGCDSDLLTKESGVLRLPRLPAAVTVAAGPCLPPPGPDTSAVVDEVEAWLAAASGSWARRAAPAAPAGAHARA